MADNWMVLPSVERRWLRTACEIVKLSGERMRRLVKLRDTEGAGFGGALGTLNFDALEESLNDRI